MTDARTPDPIDVDPEDLDAPVVVPAIVNADAQMRLGGPLPASIVHDARDNRLRRLTIVAFVLLGAALLAILIRGIYAARHELTTAQRQRDSLIHSVDGLSTAVGKLSDTDHKQSIDLHALFMAIQEQNRVCRRRPGCVPVALPTLTSEGGGAHGNGRSSTPRSSPAPSAPPSSPPPPTPRGSASPTPSPVVQVCLPNLPCVHPLAYFDGWTLYWHVGGGWRAMAA